MNRGNDQVTILVSNGAISVSRRALAAYPSLLSAQENLRGRRVDEIDLQTLPVEVVREIVNWAERHADDGLDRETEVTLNTEDVAELSSLDPIQLFALIQAADQHNLLDLLDGACQIAARYLEQTDIKTIRDLLFGGISGFESEQEESKLLREYQAIAEL